MVIKTPERTKVEARDWPPPQGEWTYEDYLRLPDDGWRYEVIKGVLHMAPPPQEPHQRASSELHFAMTGFVKSRGLGRVYAAPFEVRLPDTSPVQPDLVFVAAERIDEIITSKRIEGVPDLIVEILSPSNWLFDRRDKYEYYETSGVREYWIVDPKACIVEVFVLREGQYALLGKWSVGQEARSEVLSGFTVTVEDVCKGE